MANDTASVAATFDGFSYGFSLFIVVAVWVMYLIPVVTKFIDNKPSMLEKKLIRGWEYLKASNVAQEIK